MTEMCQSCANARAGGHLFPNDDGDKLTPRSTRTKKSRMILTFNTIRQTVFREPSIPVLERIYQVLVEPAKAISKAIKDYYMLLLVLTFHWLTWLPFLTETENLGWDNFVL